MQGTPHNVEGQPPERDEPPTPPAGDADEQDDTNPERQGPDPEQGGSGAESEVEGDPSQSGPPPESIPGDEGSVPNPKGA